MYKWNKPEDIVSSKVDFWILFSSVKEKLINQPLCTCVNHSVQKKNPYKCIVVTLKSSEFESIFIPLKQTLKSTLYTSINHSVETNKVEISVLSWRLR